MVVLSRLLAAVVLWLLVMMVINLEMETLFKHFLSFFIRFFNRHMFLMLRPRCCIFLCLFLDGFENLHRKR